MSAAGWKGAPRTLATALGASRPQMPLGLFSFVEERFVGEMFFFVQIHSAAANLRVFWPWRLARRKCSPAFVEARPALNLRESLAVSTALKSVAWSQGCVLEHMSVFSELTLNLLFSLLFYFFTI